MIDAMEVCVCNGRVISNLVWTLYQKSLKGWDSNRDGLSYNHMPSLWCGSTAMNGLNPSLDSHFLQEGMPRNICPIISEIKFVVTNPRQRARYLAKWKIQGLMLKDWFLEEQVLICRDDEPTWRTAVSLSKLEATPTNIDL